MFYNNKLYLKIKHATKNKEKNNNKKDKKKIHFNGKKFFREKKQFSSPPYKEHNESFTLKLRAAHGTFNLQHKDLLHLHNCSSSEQDCSYEYHPKMRSLFDLKSNYVHINFLHSEDSQPNQKNSSSSSLDTTAISFHRFRVLPCNRHKGYLKILIDINE